MSNLHRATVIGPQVMERVVSRKLAALPGAPPGLLDRGVGGDLAVRLERAADPALDRGEPSWGAAARFVRETRFLQTWRRLAFMKENWSVPTGEYWEGAKGLVVDHPFRPFLHSFVVPATDPGSDLPAFARALDLTELDRGAYPLQLALQPVLDPREFVMILSLSDHHGDPVPHDLTAALRSRSDAVKSPRRLLATCPFSPVAMGMLVSEDWDASQPHLAEWERVAGAHPSFLSGLCRYYEKAGRKEELEKALERYIAASPDHWAFQKLADAYKARGSRKLWKATLDRFLAEVEDHGLDHAQARAAEELIKGARDKGRPNCAIILAQYLANRGRHDDARPYWTIAAESPHTYYWFQALAAEALKRHPPAPEPAAAEPAAPARSPDEKED